MPRVTHLPHLRETQVVGDLPDTFRTDVIEGLSRPAGRKSIPAKHLYDAEGSRIFEAITVAPEYYPTRTEAAIWSAQLDAIASRLGPGVNLIEPGSGSGEKAAALLRALDRPSSFTPIEVSRAALDDAAQRLAAEFLDVELHPVLEDFSTGLSVPDAIPTGRRVVFFPGSTIGNLDRVERHALLTDFARVIEDDGFVLLGFDLVKDRDVLRRAYNGDITVRFNLNLLHRMRRDLDCDVQPANFTHQAPWVEDESRIEMHLISAVEQSFAVEGHTISLDAGERIHTENSHKFTRETIVEEAAGAGLEAVAHFTDDQNWFDVALLRPA